jgi:hypothetical protein
MPKPTPKPPNKEDHMPTFRVKAEVTVTYLYIVDADTIEDAITRIEDGDEDDNSTDIDNTEAKRRGHANDGEAGRTYLTHIN